MEAITRKVKCVRGVGLIKAGKNVLNRIQQIGPDPAPVAAFKEPFQPPVFEAPNHQDTQCSDACHLSSADSYGDILRAAPAVGLRYGRYCPKGVVTI